MVLLSKETFTIILSELYQNKSNQYFKHAQTQPFKGCYEEYQARTISIVLY